MSHNARQGDIASSFAKETTGTSQIPSSPGPSSSLPNTPVKPVPRSRNTVIAASDDEDDDGSLSDGSLEDLSTIMGTRRSEQARVKPSIHDTPKAKRTALGLPTSPLTINPKVHKFDISALANAARLDDAISAASARAKAAAEDMDRQTAVGKAGQTSKRGSSDEDDEDKAFMGVVADNAGDDAHKILRAVKRADKSGGQSRYCFFDTNYETPAPTSAPKVSGPWRILTRGNALEREQSVASGLTQTLLSTIGPPPEDLLDWILDEICVQNSALLRLEYINLVAQSPPLAERLLTPERLDELLIRLGASQELQVTGTALNLAKLADEPYAGRNWACLSSFLSLLAELASSLRLETAVHTAHALLRLSIDPVVLQSPGLLIDYQEAIAALLNAVSLSSWDSFCADTSSLFHTLVPASKNRISIVVCLPIQNLRSHDLRRRLAVCFFFDDPSLAQSHPSDSTSLRDLIDHLYTSPFTIHSKTDFPELQANVLLLDAAVDDGFFSSRTPGEGSDHARKAAEKAFNAEIDELADRLRGTWRKINDAGLKLSRSEAKGVIEWVQQRLSHSVRTRKKMRKSVFDLESGGDLGATKRKGAADDPFLPKQQDYMKKFLQKPKAERQAEG